MNNDAGRLSYITQAQPFERPVRAGVIVAHPDDETLWCGGLILMHPEWEWVVISLCRGSDHERAARFKKAMRELGAEGIMGDLNDGPEQWPLDETVVENLTLYLVDTREFDIVLTHNLQGEYTRHRRHEEVGAAVLELWTSGELITRELWMFAYEDEGRAHLPLAIPTADKVSLLPPEIWQKKHEIITNIYGFSEDSFEGRTTPRTEAFLIFNSMAAVQEWREGTVASPAR